MSWRALHYVETITHHYDGIPMNCYEKSVLRRMAYRHSEETRAARVGFSELENAALCSRMTVIRAVKALEDHFTIIRYRFRKERDRNDLNLYFFSAFEVKDGTSRGKEITLKMRGEGLPQIPSPNSPEILPEGLPQEPTGIQEVPRRVSNSYQGGYPPDTRIGVNLKDVNQPGAQTAPLDPAANTAAVSLPFSDPQKELEDRRKIEARDRREKMEAAARPNRAEAHAGTGPEVGRPTFCARCGRTRAYHSRPIENIRREDPRWMPHEFRPEAA